MNLTLEQSHNQGICPDHCPFCKSESSLLRSEVNPQLKPNPCVSCGQSIQPHLVEAKQSYCLDCFPTFVLRKEMRELEQMYLHISEKQSRIEDLSKLCNLPIDIKRFQESAYWKCQTEGCTFSALDYIQREVHIRDTAHSFEKTKPLIDIESAAVRKLRESEIVRF